MKKLGMAVLLATVIGPVCWPASPASAHPLGDFSVNQYAGLTLRPDGVGVAAVVDVAEIPALQDKTRADADAGGTVSGAELTAYGQRECLALAGSLAVTVSGQRLEWTVPEARYELTPGTGGLSTGRLTCSLTAPAELTAPATVTVENGYRADRVGWREMTAVGDGVRVTASTLPVASLSGQLRSYPADLLSSALDVRSGSIEVSGPGAAAVPAAPPGGGPLSAGPAWLTGAQNRVEEVLGGRLDPLVVGLAFALALLLGAGHAVLPGHGKTVMAAYFAGRRGRIRDAMAIGGTVTLAHTGGVLLMGLILSTSTALAGEQVLRVLGVVSGLLVVAVGTGMLVTARRTHAHHHGHTHTHHHGHAHTHHRLNLAGIGLAGGLVPSPSALVVLLGAIGLGRAGLGFALVVAYGAGMAATLTGTGLLLSAAQHRLGHLFTGAGRLGALSGLGRRIAASAPTATAALIVVVGVGISARTLALV
ncbi:hypothetical protein ACTI_52940 [Actinoplanes sp. OR16]|uniref:High-affinity nickel-transporter n=1 Tax=Actinoplanes sp. OR16 TaxID=946334 RepID=UPI000F6E46AC|nr:High-affinity nickel-transporter [Actinoplanes sp. OR16]BBH68609.1 hypothetical protein ACTI_52940 [Actinoplanes sp. OR16]